MSLLFHLAQRAKTVRDVEDGRSENLYRASELAQEVLKARARALGWTIPSFPGKVKIPMDVFKPLGSVEAGKQVRGGGRNIEGGRDADGGWAG